MTPQELTKRREHVGLEQRELAEKVGITPAYLSMMETGKRRITDAMAERLGGVLSVEEVRTRARRDAAWRAVLVAMNRPHLRAMREKEGFSE